MTESYQRVGNLLGALALAVSDRLRAATEGEEDGLAASQPAALVTLGHYPGQSIVTLGRTLGLTHSGAVRLVDRLESAGLLCRTTPGRGRTLALQLTETGRQAAQQVLARRDEELSRIVRLLDPDDAAALERLAARLLAGLTTDRSAAYRLCRLCDEPLCAAAAGCPVDHAAAG
jgi:MarR family transcriptional regulator, negative regulator of the multidrug operon emrRAB